MVAKETLGFAGKRPFSALLLALVGAIAPAIFGQSLTTGDIAGTVRDPTGAVIPDVTAYLNSLDTGAARTVETGPSGDYRFRLLPPGHYQITVEKVGFARMGRPVEVAVGTIVTADFTLVLGSAIQKVDVSPLSPMLNSEPSINTNFTPQQLQEVPVPGGDITAIAFTAPGVVVNVTGGFGNFTLNGLPANSNLFTINGENNMDPYGNLNKSGPSNLTIGKNELQEAAVVANPYSGQYGQLAGAQVVYSTLSGTNQFHGNAIYSWNGRYMNSNDWFNNLNGVHRPFSNANQWAARIGGPIRKDKTFFFVDTEGLRFILPTVFSVTTPAPAFASAVLNNVQAKQPAEAAAYQKLFALWANAPGSDRAAPLTNNAACKSLTLAGFNPAEQPCAHHFQNSLNAVGNEWSLAFRIDQRIGDNDSTFFRYKADHGLQPSYLDPISANFDALSSQPSYDIQFSETHIFGPRSTNNFISALSHYVKQSQQNAPLVASTFPYGITNSSPVPFTSFNRQFIFPEGRNITQYQLIDDITLNHGRHNLKYGFNFRRYDFSDHNFLYNSPQVAFGGSSAGLQRFVDGLAFSYTKALNFASDVPIAMWGLGLYAEDQWNPVSNLKITLALRAERNSNPVCQFNCFANLIRPAYALPSFTNPNPAAVPYSSDIASNLHQAYQGVDALLWSPRAGFSWSPGVAHKTVVSGGFLIVYDSPGVGRVDYLLGNPPVAVHPLVQPAAGTLPFDPAGAPAIWQASVNAFSINKSLSQISSALTALGATFAPPSLVAIIGTMHAPEWREWNVQVQRQLGNNMVLAVNYAGNAGRRIPYKNAWANAYDQHGLYPGVPGIPAMRPVPNYGTVTQVQNGAISNYNGMSVSLMKRFTQFFSAHFSYTWSHSLDEVSNGGLLNYGDSILGEINPLSLRANNYGNADYDIRHNLSGDFVFSPRFQVNHAAMKHLVNGWQISGKVFWRSGLPFSVFDGYSGLGNGGGAVLATPLGQGWGQTECGASAAVGGQAIPCITLVGHYLDSNGPNFDHYAMWSPQTRNQLRGPNFSDLDLSLYKNFSLTERVAAAVGITAFNALNHPNFDLPDSNISSATFGQIRTTAHSPLSPYGASLGFDSSVRVAQLTAKITF
jgi:hypothetical protein